MRRFMFLIRSLLIIFICLSSQLESKPQWTVLIYADPAQTLTDALIKNINDIATFGSSEHAKIYVQLRTYTSHEADDDMAWRYRIEKNALILEESLKPTGNYIRDTTEAAHWAFGKQETRYHALILSGHGHGILEPTWDSLNNTWQLEPDDAESMCQLKRKPHLDFHRGVLMNELTHSFMTNDEMCVIFKNIYDYLGKKIDVVGFDCCLGASLEHAFQLAPFIHYFVGCQTCELMDGFEFTGFARRLAAPTCTPHDLVAGMIIDYQRYYQAKAKYNIYTLSALDCNRIDTVITALNNAVLMLKELLINQPNLRKNFLDARKQCTNFCFVPVNPK